jgi:hypothetical protein
MRFSPFLSANEEPAAIFQNHSQIFAEALMLLFTTNHCQYLQHILANQACVEFNCAFCGKHFMHYFF